MTSIKKFIWSWHDLQRFRKLPVVERRIVFYSEGRAYGSFLAPVMESLIEKHGVRLCYLTSDATDPFLNSDDGRIATFYIGRGIAMITAFQNLKAGVLVMTMPDLNMFHIKRSVHPVHYVYLHHSMVSTHMIYREGAFDHFDSILCVGPHQVAETRAWERLRGLPEKRLFEHGYGPLDALLHEAAHRPPRPPLRGDGRRVLLAPSWGAKGILEAHANALVEILLTAGHRVWVRPHPRTRQLAPQALDDLTARFGGHERFIIDEDTTALDALFDAEVMITDWSGVALEFALGLKRPVLFIDVPRKINNPHYQDIEPVPLEVVCREEIGAVLDPNELGRAPAMVETLCQDRGAFTERARRLSAKTVFNVGKSGARGAEIIARLAADA